MFQRLLVWVVLNSLALYLVTWIFDSIHYTGGLKFIVFGGIIIGLVNGILKPLLTLLSLPLVFCTLGLVMVAINALLFWLTIELINAINLSGVAVTVDSGWTYVFASVAFGIVNWILNFLFKK
jgi:putative membrane protein